MTLLTHGLIGLIIGKITGNYQAAMIGSLAVDLDHVICYYKHKVLFNPRRLLEASLKENDKWDDERNILHNFLIFLAISIMALLINFHFGLILFIAYFLHLTADAADNINYYPFFPSKKYALKGFIKYFSKQEALIELVLIIALAIIPS